MFQKGQSGNPKGRPKGSRHKLGESFISDLAEHWAKNGKAALDGALAESPAAYVRAVASLMPKEMVIERPLSELSDADLTAIVDQLQSEIARAAGLAEGAGAEIGGEPPEAVPTLQ